jgi:hypothetical protein
LLTTLKRIGEWATIAFGAVLGIAFAGFLVGAITIFLFHVLAPSLPVEAIAPPAHNIANWRSLVGYCDRLPGHFVLLSLRKDFYWLAHIRLRRHFPSKFPD